MGQPRKAIELYEDDAFSDEIAIHTVRFLIEIAHAYCDVREYESAVHLCDRAWRKNEDGSPRVLKTSHKEMIFSVYARIKQESGSDTKALRQRWKEKEEKKNQTVTARKWWEFKRR